MMPGTTNRSAMPRKYRIGSIPVSLSRKRVASVAQLTFTLQLAMPLVSYRWARAGRCTPGRWRVRPGRRMSRWSGRGTGARSATSLLSLQGRLAAGRGGGPAHVGQDQVLQADLAGGPRGVVARASGADQQRALPAGVAGRDDLPVSRPGAGIAAGPGELAVRGEQFPDLAGELDPGGDDHDQEVADPLQVGDQVRGHHDADLVPGGELRQALQELAAGERVEAGDRLVEDEQLGLLGDGQGQGELGALPTRQLPGLLARVQAQPLDPVAGQRGVPARVEMGAEPQVVGYAEPGVGGRVLRDEADL